MDYNGLSDELFDNDQQMGVYEQKYENYDGNDGYMDGSVAMGDDMNMNEYAMDMPMDNNNNDVDAPRSNPYDDEEDVVIPGVNDLPLFANPETRKLDLKIKKKQVEYDKLVEDINDLKERMRVMKDHFKNVQQELEHTNALYNAKHAEIQTEHHLKQLTSRNLGRLQLESKKLQNEIETYQDQLSSLQQSIFNANERMDEFKMQMNWNQEELEQWAVAAKQKEEDALALQKYTRSDELKIKELSMTLEQLTKECLIKRSKVENEATETQAKQMELDRVAVDFKKLHVERQSLIARWQETIEEMKRRDIEINQLAERFAKAKSERERKAALVLEQQKRLSAQKKENQEVEARSEVLGRVVSNKRDEMMQGNIKLQDLRDELESLKNELTTAAESLVTKRHENTNKSKAMEEKRVQLEREQQKYILTKKKLEEAKSSVFKEEELAKQSEDDLNQTERDYQAQISKQKLLKDKYSKENQAVFDLKREEARLRGEVVGSKTQSKNMETQLAILDKEAARQQELLYNAEFQIQQIERKLARGMGERSDDEKRALRKATEEAELRRDQAKEKRKMLNNQVRKLQNELVTSKARRDELLSLKIKLSEKQAELELENRMLEDDVKKDVKQKEEIMIGNDVLRLEVRRLRDLLSAKADVVFSLENRKQQLLLSMEERKSEISVHKDVLKAQYKTINDEKHKLITDLRDRESKVEKLKARFEIVPRGDDEGHSQAYFVIKAAQKREELQRKGDELDQDVRKCERDIRALQATLDHLNVRNIAYRTSFMKLDIDSEDAQTLKALEERAKAAKDNLFRRKKDLQRVVTDLEEDERRVDQLKTSSNRVFKQRENLEHARAQVEEEILTQQTQNDELAQRIERMIIKQREKVSQETGADVEAFMNGTLEEKAANAEVLKDVVQNVLYTLGQLASEFPEVQERLSNKLKDADLRMPMQQTRRIQE